MTLFIQQIVNGLVIGSTYALVAVGFTTVYGVVNILNVAQADLVTLTGYAGLFAFTALGFGVGGVIGAIILASVLIGLVLYYGLFIRLRSTDLLAMFVATIGISFVIEYGLARVEGSAPQLFPSFLPFGSVAIDGVTVSYAQLIVFCVSVGLSLAVGLGVAKTRIGRHMKAVAASPEIAAAMGVNVGRIRLLTVITSSVLAGIAGFLLASYYASVNPFLGQTLAFNMFVIAIVGGVGSTLGTMVVSLAVGIIPAVTSMYLDPNITSILPLLLMVLILRFRPEGLFGSVRLRYG
jgi:branched-chain amino acid transport system permease protein